METSSAEHQHLERQTDNQSGEHGGLSSGHAKLLDESPANKTKVPVRGSERNSADDPALAGAPGGVQLVAQQGLPERDGGEPGGHAVASEHPESAAGHDRGDSGELEPEPASIEATERLADPRVWCEWFLGSKLDPGQRAIAADCMRNGRIAVRAANGVGKTILVPALGSWWLAAHENSRVVITAGVYRQLMAMADYLRQFKHRLSGWDLIEHELTAPDGCKAVWYSTDNDKLFEGQHAENLMLILDEAKSIPRSIWMASERLQAKLVLIMSSTGAATGPFYECFTSRKAQYSCHKITAGESSWVSRSWIDYMRETYGETSDIYKSAVLAEFTNAEVGAFISLEAVNRCIHQPCLWSKLPLIAGLDLAASAAGDESVLAIREGNKITELVCWRDSDPMRVAGRAMQELADRRIEKTRVFADAGGIGAGIVSRMREVGWPINQIQFGSAATRDKQRLTNRMTEIWDDMKRMIDDNRIILPDDDRLIAQLTSRMVIPQSNGSVKLESKEMMRRRGLESPDRADAVALALCNPEAFEVIPPLHSRRSKLSDYLPEDDMLATDKNLLNTTCDGEFSLGRG